jgi:hypothetical protein
MKDFQNQQERYTSLFILMIGMAMVFMFAMPVQAQDNLCVPNIGGLAGSPTIDGIVEDDAGWNGAARVNLSVGLGTTRSAVLQMGKTGADVYISFVVETPSADLSDTIVLVLSTDGNPAHDWRIHIQPFVGGVTNGENQVPTVVTYWRNSTTWNNPGAISTPALDGFWLKDNIRFSNNDSHWAIEIKIPIETNIANAGSNDAIYFPTGTGPGDTFKFYANVLIPIILPGIYVQYPWPAGHIIISGTGQPLTQSTPAAFMWGTLSLFPRSAVCTGVSLAWSDIGVEDPNNPGVIISQIRRYNPPGGFPEPDMAACDALANNYQWPLTKGPLNTFIAKPYNGMAANKPVSAEFRVANWGIPGPNDWRPIGEVAGGLSLTPPTVPAAGPNKNPTPESGIPPGSYGSLTSQWELSYKQSCLYSYRHHQCIQVNLDSTDNSTVFLNKSVQRNMNFVPASEFTRSAEISAIGYGTPPENREKHEFIVTVDTGVQRYIHGSSTNETSKIAAPPLRTWGSIGKYEMIPSEIISKYFAAIFKLGKSPKRFSEAKTWVARGYLKTGKYLIIRGKKYEYVKHVGGFGYTAMHNGEVLKWKQRLHGGELDPIPNSNMYSIQIEPGKVATVNTTIEAVEPRFAISLRAGLGIPHGAFDLIVDPGLSMNAGFEISLDQNWSAEAVFGYHHFADGGLGANQNVFQFSGNCRYFYPFTRNFRTFINAGAGRYKMDPGNWEFGVNGGVGVDIYLTNQLAFEAAYNYHNLFNVNIRFSTIQGGLRIRF